MIDKTLFNVVLKIGVFNVTNSNSYSIRFYNTINKAGAHLELLPFMFTYPLCVTIILLLKLELLMLYVRISA